MRPTIGILLSPLLLLITSATTPAPGHAAILNIEPTKQLRKGVDAWPLIVNPANPAEQNVNAILTGLNLRFTKALAECDAAALDDMKRSKTPQKDWPGGIAEDWSRKITVTMLGPRILSLVAIDDYVNCAGAHPNSDTMAMVFDLTSGMPVDWLALLAKSAGASAFADAVSDGSTVAALILPALAKINIAEANEDCKDAFQDSQAFQLWPDANSGTLVALAFDLPHAAADCAVRIPLTLEQARSLGFDESLLGAIEEAHRLAPGAAKP